MQGTCIAGGQAQPVGGPRHVVAANGRARQQSAVRPVILVGVADAELRAKIVVGLGGTDHEVVAVSNGFHLIERVADAILSDSTSDGVRPKLIVADSVLPGCKGLTLLAGIRDLGWDTPVILLSPPDDERSRREAVAWGVCGVLVEPVDVGELCALSELVLDPATAAAIRAARSSGKPWLRDVQRPVPIPAG